MPQFQILVVGATCAALLANWLVFSAGFHIGAAPFLAIVFLLFSVGLFFWTFFTQSGREYALKYNIGQEQQAEKQREEREKTKEIFMKDVELIKQNKK